MFKEFVSNLAILIASFSIMGQIFKNHPLYHTSPILTKLYWGLSFGILGNLLMVYSIPIQSGIIVDLRHLAIVIAAAFGGFIPALISAALTALGRIVLFGYNPSAILPSIAILLIGFLCGGISKMKFNSTSKAFVMNIIGLFIISGILGLRITNATVMKNVLIVHYTISLIGGFIAYHFLEFITKSNEARRNLTRNVMKLKETEERFRLIAEYSSDMITMHNENTEYVYISPAVKEIIHFDYLELLGKQMKNFVHPDDCKLTQEIFEKALAEGDAQATYRYRSKLGDYVWIESTMKSVPYQLDGRKRVIIVSRNITDRKLTEQKLQEANKLLNQLSYIDGLTGISNRRYFDNTLDNEWINAMDAHAPLSLVMLDIDYFKKYNDTYGHLAGDFCLQAIANAIKSLFTTDTGYTFCRYGGEEFAVILPFTATVKANTIAEKIKTTVQSLNISHISSEIADRITLSIGVATIIPDSSANPQLLIEKADSALYLSKTEGRNAISYVTS